MNNAIRGNGDPPDKILETMLEDFDANDVRLRLVDWRGKAVVYVPSWSKVNASNNFDEKGTDPKLFSRVFFDRKEKQRVDCFVGLVTRLARIDQAQAEDWDPLIIKDLQFFNNNNQNSSGIFNDYTVPIIRKFLKKLKNDARQLRKLCDAWDLFNRRITKAYEAYQDTNDKQNFYIQVENAGPPWEWEHEHNRRVSQWNQLRDQNDDPARFKEHVNKTLIYYKEKYEKWRDYCSATEAKQNIMKELAIPVIFNHELFGVVNIHRDNTEFNEVELDRANDYAGLLALSVEKTKNAVNPYLEKITSFENDNYQVTDSRLASILTDGVRDILFGLEDSQVYPLLYVCKTRPINAKDDLQDFSERWKDTYVPRENVGEIEKRLGEISIRIRGLGYESLQRWQSRSVSLGQSKATGYFVVCGDVNNPDSIMGSRTAMDEEIQTTGCLPLVYNNKVYGLLYIHCMIPHFFTELELEGLRKLANNIARIIELRQLYGPPYPKMYTSSIINAINKGPQ